MSLSSSTKGLKASAQRTVPVSASKSSELCVSGHASHDSGTSSVNERSSAEKEYVSLKL